MRWTIRHTLEPQPGWQQMATDDALLDLAVEERVVFVRLYRWSPPCLSFGRNEPARARYDRSLIEALGWATVRRPTGGRAVWHGEELTYAVAAPHEALGGPRQAYRMIHQALARAISSLGTEASLATAPARTAPLAAGACFAEPAGGEVMVRGRKIVGSAQVRRGPGLLQHGSILLGGDQGNVARVTLGEVPPGAEGALEALLGRGITYHELADAVDTALETDWGTDEECVASWARLEDNARRYYQQYRDPDWTWRR